MENFKNGDRLSRTFKKIRGERSIEYKYETFSSIFNYKFKKGHLNKLRVYMKKVFLSEMPIRDLSCSTGATLVVDWYKGSQNDLTLLSQQSCALGNGFKQHEILQEYLMENDPLTIGIELSVHDDGRQGFIDVVRILPDGKIQIADYKPHLNRENITKVMTQLKYYKYLLAMKLKISHNLIECCCFDEEEIYYLK